jgi:hypothetical protein
MVKRGTLSAETVGLGSVLRVAPFAPCANAWLCLTNDRAGLLGGQTEGGLALGICATVMRIPRFDDSFSDMSGNYSPEKSDFGISCVRARIGALGA